MAFQKNVSGQKLRVKAIDLAASPAGSGKTGDAAQITCKVSKDFGMWNALTDVNPVEVEIGWYEFDLTQAETNADHLGFIADSSTASIEVMASPAECQTVVRLDAANSLPAQGAPSATASIIDMIRYLFKSWRNKSDNDGTIVQLYADDASTVDHKRGVSKVLGTVTQEEWESGP